MNIDINSILQTLNNPFLYPHMEKFIWIFIGITFTVAINSICLFILTKDINYLNYFLHILSINYINFSITGFGESYIWYGYPNFTKLSLLLSHGLSVISVIVFTDYFLNLKVNSKLIHNFFKYYIILPVTMMIISFINFELALVFIPFMGITLSIALIYIPIIAIKNKLPGAKFYLFSMFSICCGGVLYSIQLLGAFEGNSLIKYSLQIGAIIEAIFLSFALSAKVRALQKEKDLITKQSLNQAKKIQELVEVSFDCYWETDKKGNFRFLSENIYRQLGYQNLEIAFRRPEDLFAEGAPNELKDLFVNSINSQTAFREVEIMAQTKDGNYLWLKANGTIRQNEKKEFDGYVGAFINSTESKYKQYEEYISTNTKSLSRVAGAIAHEINNPLAFIQLCIDLMENKHMSKDKINDKIFLENLEKMRSSTLRISGIISKLQRMVVDEPSSLPFKCLLSEPVQIAIKFCEAELDKNNVKCEFNLLENEKEIYIKKDDISNAIVNLLLNAVEALEKNENPIIKISLEEIENEMVLTISDSGKGIPLSQRKSIFEPFFTTKEFKNLGLGLSQAMNFVERSGGVLSLDPLSKETKFILKFKIPLK
ncbi:7TM diverse intracellular signaling domain-containing protein [Fluviispira multicolorata]|uniref:histidine kinase n=1 Tax=Fluviispira multicolorata TaxID=2654512 RepID=A0A833JBA2_9BACT|nr:7TM diverse intracellular signaling domain-containing protein [Fluviispira multicolorata]KAB8029097.1 PAS domain S-box protein [Fluviispira multicolorata]